MRRETLVWTIILLAGTVAVALNAGFRGAGRAYVKETHLEFVQVGTDADPHWIATDSDEALDHDLAAYPASTRRSWTAIERVPPRDFYEYDRTAPAERDPGVSYRFSLAQTIGVWLAAIFTLAIFSFLYRDNPFYKTAEAIVVGVSAAYWMVVGFWDTIVPNLLGKLAPDTIQAMFLPGVSGETQWMYLVPLILGIMLLWRLAPVGGWISRWPMAFIIGVFCGIRLLGFLHGDFLSQIRNSIDSMYVLTPDPATGLDVFDPWQSLKNLTLLVGVLTCLVYFFFSIEHKGVVGKTARVGIWFLMITFGAAFGYTVMGRIALLSIRLEFLFDDWLWLIDPLSHRVLG